MSTHTFLKYHIVFGTQYRRPVIRVKFRKQLYAYISGIINGEGGHLDAIGGTDGHVHILCGIPPRIAVSDMLRAIKSSFIEMDQRESALHHRISLATRFCGFFRQ